jgi:hypothetical protein
MHRFRIAALADPQSLPRITGFFGQRGLVPASKLGALFAVTDVAMSDGVPAE